MGNKIIGRYKTGDIIKIDDPAAQMYANGVAAGRSMMHQGATREAENQSKLWARIHELYPELREYNLSYDHTENTLEVKGKMENRNGK